MRSGSSPPRRVFTSKQDTEEETLEPDRRRASLETQPQTSRETKGLMDHHLLWTSVFRDVSALTSSDRLIREDKWKQSGKALMWARARFVSAQPALKLRGCSLRSSSGQICWIPCIRQKRHVSAKAPLCVVNANLMWTKLPTAGTPARLARS